MKKNITVKKIIAVSIITIFFSSSLAFGYNSNESTTTPAESITNKSATLTGTSTSNNHLGLWETWFEYDTSQTAFSAFHTPSFQTTKEKTKQWQNAPIGKVLKTIKDLIPNKKYYYRFCAERTTGISSIDPCGDVLSFTTKAAPETCTISSFTANPIKINYGAVASLSWNTTGCTTLGISYLGSINPIDNINVAPPSDVTYTLTASSDLNQATKQVSVTVVPLPSSSSPFVSLISSQGGTVITNAPTTVTDISAKLNGSIAPSLDFPAGEEVNVYFRYSTQTDFPPVFCNDIYGSSMRSTKEIKVHLATGVTVPFSTVIANLAQDTTYYYCAIASNKNRIANGQLKSFTTWPDQTVSVNTLAPLVSGGTSVYLNGFYNTALPATTFFEYKKVTSAAADRRASSAQAGMTGSFRASGTQADMTGSLSEKEPNPWSAKIYSQSHNKNTNGNISHKLTGLTPSTSYKYHLAIQPTGDSTIYYGDDVQFTTTELNDVGLIYDNPTGGNGGNNSGNGGSLPPLVLGQTATPPADAVVHYHEGIETVMVRQIMKNTQLAHAYGYVEGTSLESFAWEWADIFARIFGYVNSNGKEIRVSVVDRAAYELRFENGKLTVYEYLDSKIINIQTMTEVLRSKYGYEYYFKK